MVFGIWLLSPVWHCPKISICPIPLWVLSLTVHIPEIEETERERGGLVLFQQIPTLQIRHVELEENWKNELMLLNTENWKWLNIISIVHFFKFRFPFNLEFSILSLLFKISCWNQFAILVSSFIVVYSFIHLFRFSVMFLVIENFETLWAAMSIRMLNISNNCWLTFRRKRTANRNLVEEFRDEQLNCSFSIAFLYIWNFILFIHFISSYTDSYFAFKSAAFASCVPYSMILHIFYSYCEIQHSIFQIYLFVYFVCEIFLVNICNFTQHPSIYLIFSTYLKVLVSCITSE